MRNATLLLMLAICGGVLAKREIRPVNASAPDAQCIQDITSANLESKVINNTDGTPAVLNQLVLWIIKFCTDTLNCKKMVQAWKALTNYVCHGKGIRLGQVNM